jgi:hypothetical protein
VTTVAYGSLALGEGSIASPRYPKEVEGIKMISSDDCKTRAVECYQAAQNAAGYDARQALLGLAVQWCELASRIDSMYSDGSASGDELPPRLHTLLKKLDQELPEQKDQ